MSQIFLQLEFRMVYVTEQQKGMSEARFQWERAFFRDQPARNPDADLHMIRKIQFLRPRGRAKFIVIAQGVLPPQYGEVALLIYLFFTNDQRTNIKYISSNAACERMK
jgi:hypothetical protein